MKVNYKDSIFKLVHNNKTWELCLNKNTLGYFGNQYEAIDYIIDWCEELQ